MSIYATGISSLVFFPILIYSFVEGKQRLVFVSDQDRSFAVLCCSSIWVLHIQVAGENVGCWCFWRTVSRLGWGGGVYLDLVQGDQVVNAREGCKKNGGCSCRGNSSLTCMVFKHLLHH